MQRRNWRFAYHECFVTFRDQWRTWRQNNSKMLATTRDGRRKYACDLTDQEIDAMAWDEAARAIDRAIHEHNISLNDAKARAGEAA